MEKNVLIENFVGIFDGFVSKQQCETLIEYFNWCEVNNRVWTRQRAEGVSSIVKSDTACGLAFRPGEINYTWPNINAYIEEFNKVFWDECFSIYSDRYGILKHAERCTIYTYKVQRTLPGQGYHVWHCEDLSRNHSSRIASYILYLNDEGIEGGETEFLYQGMRVAPLTGRLILFPSGYTHAHRGNPPLKGVKYIMTGWVEFS